ncbi:MAG TPA: UbiA family prenyltransferase [Thermoplasmataceae archaeon]|nr:UbiA family prenyltransferase [Thermoplasmataceae archaeon]
MNADLLHLLRKSKTMTISTLGNGTWTTKVFYAMDRGFIFFVEKGASTLRNIQSNPEISFAIDNDRLEMFVQGKGRVEILGEPADYERERGILLYKVPEDTMFMRSGHVLIARLIPEEIRVTDMRMEMKRFSEPVVLEEMREKRHPLFNSMRVWSFQQSAVAYLIGTFLAARIDMTYFALGLVALLLAHGSFNIFSGYFDYRSGNDSILSMTSSRVFVDRLLSGRIVLYFASAILGVAVAIGIFLSLEVTKIIPFVAIGVTAGFLYSLPKIGLKKFALGDLAVFVTWGVGIFLGAFTLQGGIISLPIVLIAASIALLTVSILHGNNWRDINDDRKAGVRTVANIVGEEGSKFYYYSLIWVPYVLVVVAYFLANYLYPLLAVLITVPFALKLSKIASNKRSIKKPLLDMLTARATLYFGVVALGAIIVAQYATGSIHFLL